MRNPVLVVGATHPRNVPFGVTYEKIGTIQRRLAWPLHKDDTLSRSGRPTGLNIYFVGPNQERDDDLPLVTATLILTSDPLDVRSYTHVVPLSLCSSSMELRVQPAHRPSLLRRARSTRNSR